MKANRIILIRAAAVLALIVIAAVMMVIGRGHTVYLDNKTLDYGGQTYSAPYQIVATVDGEEVADLRARDRGMAICIGQTFNMTLAITQERDGEEEVSTVALPLPYNMDGIIINLPAYLAGLPEEAYLTEFVPVPEEPDESEEEIPVEGEDMLGDI